LATAKFPAQSIARYAAKIMRGNKCAQAHTVSARHERSRDIGLVRGLANIPPTYHNLPAGSDGCPAQHDEMDGWDGLRLFSGLPPVTVAQVLRQAMRPLARVMSLFLPSASFSPSNPAGTGALLSYKVLGEKGRSVKMIRGVVGAYLRCW
jgi:hypothetical protein